jgi:hypothetical protein
MPGVANKPFILSAIMLGVVMLGVIMLSVVAPIITFPVSQNKFEIGKNLEQIL